MSAKLQELNYTQIAKEVGCHVSHVSMVIRGERTPSIDMAGKLARAVSRQLGYSVSLDQFVAMLPKTPQASTKVTAA